MNTRGLRCCRNECMLKVDTLPDFLRTLCYNENEPFENLALKYCKKFYYAMEFEHEIDALN